MNANPTVFVRLPRAVGALAGGVLVFLLLSMIAPVARFGLGLDTSTGLLGFAENAFNLNGEANPPTWYATVLLLVAAFLLGYIGLAGRASGHRWSTYWLVLGGIFLVLSMDEASALHERGNKLGAALGLSGVLLYSWIFFGAAFVLIVGLAYARFLWALPFRTRAIFLLSAAVFVGGALGLEVAQSHYAANFPGYADSLRRVVLTHTEEVMEMTGVILFIYGLLDYIRSRHGGIAVVIDPVPSTAAEAPVPAQSGTG
jgi:hypothetical protein